jgi:nitrogen fixation-related uncharacterized protein
MRTRGLCTLVSIHYPINVSIIVIIIMIFLLWALEKNGEEKENRRDY